MRVLHDTYDNSDEKHMTRPEWISNPILNLFLASPKTTLKMRLFVYYWRAQGVGKKYIKDRISLLKLLNKHSARKFIKLRNMKN